MTWSQLLNRLNRAHPFFLWNLHRAFFPWRRAVLDLQRAAEIYYERLTAALLSVFFMFLPKQGFNWSFQELPKLKLRSNLKSDACSVIVCWFVFFFLHHLNKNSTVHTAKAYKPRYSVEDWTPTGFAEPVILTKFLPQFRNFVSFYPLPIAYRGR